MNMETLVDALREFPTDYATRVMNFLYEYAGTREEPAPFGGRAAQLVALDKWLDDESAPPYALIVAEAGRGKSALLVHWALSLEARADVHVVFIPISLRFETALENVALTALAARLAHVYGEEIKWGNFSALEWRGLCESYLARTPPEGTRVVVVLDGLDEAVGWQAGVGLFSRTPPPRVRVVVAARQLAGDEEEQGWRRRLGWESPRLAWSLPLPPLDEAGLRDVLQAMGDPLSRLATTVDVVAALFHLTKGDPLLVRLYVEALLPYGENVAMLPPEELERLRPGLAGYFGRWWEDQRRIWGRDHPLRERAVVAVFNLLAVALGPLDRETLLDLAPSEAGLDGHLLDEALASLGRLVVGDGRRQGYVFSHRALRQYFRDQLASRERKAVQARFLAFGRDTLFALNLGSLHPNDVPDYALRYYGAHLDQARAPDVDVYALVSDGWRRAWEVRDETNGGFLADVEHAWRRADAAFESAGSENARVEALTIQVRGALCRSSIASLSTNIPTSVLSQAVAIGLLLPGHAMVIARLTANEQKCAAVLIALAPHLPSDTITEAVEVARAIHDDESRASALRELASHLPSGQRQSVLEEALRTARSIRDEGARTEALGALALKLPSGQRQSVLEEALRTARSIRDRDSRARALITLMSRLPPVKQSGVLKEALAAARAIHGDRFRAEALGTLASYLPLEQQQPVLEEALAAARSIHDEPQAQLLGTLTPHLPAEKRQLVLKEALVAALSIGRDEYRARALRALAPHLTPSLLREALATRAGGDDRDRARDLGAMAPHLPPMVLREALAATKAIRDDAYRAEALGILAPHFPSEQRQLVLHEALSAAWAVNDGKSRTEILRALARHLPVEQQQSILEDALAAARTISDNRERVEALCALTPHLRPEQQQPVIEDALAAARAIRDDGARAIALGALAPHLPPSALAEALGATRAIGRNDVRRSVLEQLMLPLVALANSDKDLACKLWQRLLRDLSRNPRQDLLHDLRVLLPFAQALASSSDGEVAAGIFQGIHEVTRWWP